MYKQYDEELGDIVWRVEYHDSNHRKLSYVTGYYHEQPSMEYLSKEAKANGYDTFELIRETRDIWRYSAD